LCGGGGVFCCDRRQELHRCLPIRPTIGLSVVLDSQGRAATTVLVVAGAGRVAPRVGEVDIGVTASVGMSGVMNGRVGAGAFRRGIVRAVTIGIVRGEAVVRGGAMSGAGALMTGVPRGAGMSGRVGCGGAMSGVAAAAGVRMDRVVVAGGMSGAMTVGRTGRRCGGCRSMTMSRAGSSTRKYGRS
jgi:hypothetical protein